MLVLPECPQLINLSIWEPLLRVAADGSEVTEQCGQSRMVATFVHLGASPSIPNSSTEVCGHPRMNRYR